MQRFRHIGDSVHYYGEGKTKRTLTKGQTIDSEMDLVNVFPGVFELVGEVVRNQTSVRVAVPAETVTAGGAGHSLFAEEDEEDAPGAIAAGEDVSEQFPEAGKAGLRIYQVGKLFNVIDPARPEAPLNPRPVTKAKLRGYI